MKKLLLQHQKIVIPAVSVLLGLIIGLGIGFIKLGSEQKIFQERIRERDKKIAFIQKKMSEEKSETIALEQKCQEDLSKVQSEKKALGGQLGKIKDQVQKLELKVKESEDALAAAKKELQVMAKNNKDLDYELKKTTAEKQAVQAELKKTSRNLGQCEANNADLCITAEELITKYRNKGLGSILMEKEPITQVKKVELEKIVQQYQEEIDQKKIKRNVAGGKNVSQ